MRPNSLPPPLTPLVCQYPANFRQAACLPLLDLAQRQNNNFCSLAVMNKVATILDMAPIQVAEVARSVPAVPQRSRSRRDDQAVASDASAHPTPGGGSGTLRSCAHSICAAHMIE